MPELKPELKQLLETPNNLAPKGGEVIFFTASDGIKLRAAIWQPTDNFLPGGKPRGTICLFQGRTETIEKYYEVIGELRQRGLVVAALDWRGQGLSERLLKNPLKGHVTSFKYYRRDLEAFIEKIVKPSCPAPHFALAHSMGGNILFREAAAGGLSCFFSRMVLTAPMLYLSPRYFAGFHWIKPGRKAYNMKIVSSFWTRFVTGLFRLIGLGGLYSFGGSNEVIYRFEDNLITSDQKRFDKMMELVTAHSELALASPTNSWVHAACHAMMQVLKQKHIKNFQVPTLIIASGADQIVSTPVIERVSPYLRVAHHITIRHARHEIMFERDDLRKQFWAAFDAYIPGSKTLQDE